MKRVLFLLAYICMGIGMATAQTATITGKVYSEADGEPVFGASVFVVGTSVGAGTDMDGNFYVSVVTDDEVAAIKIGAERRAMYLAKKAGVC